MFKTISYLLSISSIKSFLLLPKKRALNIAVEEQLKGPLKTVINQSLNNYILLKKTNIFIKYNKKGQLKIISVQYMCLYETTFVICVSGIS